MMKVKRILLPLLLSLALSTAGCGLNSFQFGDTKIKVDPSTGSVQVEDDQGTVSVNTGSQLPEGFPAELFPLPSGATITSSLSGEAPGQGVGKTYVVTADSSDSMSSLVKFYEGSLGDGQNFSKMDVNGSTNLVGSKNGYSFVININPNDNQTSTINISVTEEKSGK